MSKKKFAHLTMEERAELARQVKPLRLQQGMTQAQLAADANTDRTTVSNIEREKAAPQAAVLERLLTVLGVETETVEFDPQTQSWLVTMGTIIESIPSERREVHVHRAIGTLSAGIKDTNVTPFPTNVGGGADYEAPEYQAVASSMERGPEEDE